MQSAEIVSEQLKKCSSYFYLFIFSSKKSMSHSWHFTKSSSGRADLSCFTVLWCCFVAAQYLTVHLYALRKSSQPEFGSIAEYRVGLFVPRGPTGFRSRKIFGPSVRILCELTLGAPVHGLNMLSWWRGKHLSISISVMLFVILLLL